MENERHRKISLAGKNKKRRENNNNGRSKSAKKAKKMAKILRKNITFVSFGEDL